ncbi:hypothetical protein UlMin_016506 [Ulmus minor]
MEQDGRKRAREEDESRTEVSDKHAKKQFEGFNFDNAKTNQSDVVVFGVFDFPWLKDGIVSKSEECKFEDLFLSPLSKASASGSGSTTITTSSGIEISLSEQVLDVPEEKFGELGELEDDGDSGFEVDNIWGSLLNQPLSLRQPN